MTQEQWETLVAAAEGQCAAPAPAFIIDSPWLPNWAGMSILDYYTSEQRWFDANMKAIETFPELTFLPGFWAEWGMCTEPSAFGARCSFPDNEFPFADKIVGDFMALPPIVTPNPRVDGLCPFVLKRLAHAQPAIEEAGHAIRFAVGRGPLNIAGFLMGNTEFMMLLKMNPDGAHEWLTAITDFLVDWAQVQAQAFPTIEGLMFLDDVVGFLGEEDFEAFALPYLKRVFEAIDAKVRFFHNDAPGLVCAPHLAGIGVNLFNFSHEHPMAEMLELTRGAVTLLGNIPPRDVLASGSPDDVRAAVAAILEAVPDHRRVMLSCGGGMPPGVPDENLRAFIEAAGA